MKKMLLASVAALVLAAATPVFAADNHHGGGGGHVGGGHGGGGGHAGGGHGGAHFGGGGHGGGGGHTFHATRSFAGGGMMGSTRHRHSVGGGTTRHSTHRGSASILSHGGNAMAAGHRSHGGANAGHARNNPAFNALRRNVTAQRHFHHGSYQRPSGWYYRRWSYGDILPSLFFGRSYWLDDYNDFGLPYPPPGTVWVRYGDDALLVDEDSGEIIQVVYGIFY